MAKSERPDLSRPSPMDASALVVETRRLVQRYIDEVVIAFDLCPWAAPALARGEVEIVVISREFPQESPIPVAADAVRDALDRAPSTAALVLVALPLLAAPRLAMDELVRLVRAAWHVPTTHFAGSTTGSRTDVESSLTLGREARFALAAFHPDAPCDLGSPERLVPFLRRSPDPLVQAVRFDVLERIAPERGAGTALLASATSLDLARFRRGEKHTRQPLSPRERTARENHRTVTAVGGDTLEAVFADLARDRAATRERLRNGRERG